MMDTVAFFIDLGKIVHNEFCHKGTSWHQDTRLENKRQY